MRKLSLALLSLLALVPFAAVGAQDAIVPSVTVTDQFVQDDTVTINEVVSAAPGWIVIHIDNEGRPGPVAGYAPVVEGSNADVVITLDMTMATPKLFAMLHDDTGEAGVYEFGTVEGADRPVAVDGKVVTPAFWTVTHMRASSQAVIGGDNVPVVEGASAADMMMAPVVTIESVLSDVAGFVVIHIDNDGAPGPVAGWGWFAEGLTEAIEINLDLGVDPTAVVWPMLHVDTGVIGEYEFGMVEGADLPISVDGAVVTFPIAAMPSLTVASQALGEGGTLTIKEAVIDADGWLVIHVSDNGAPGRVIGGVALAAGAHSNVVITLDDAAAAGEQVFPMLHYDTNVIGEYEFGTVEGADAPVFVAEAVVVVPLTVEG
ncbi:MAG: hypothetical protein SGJ24_13165 [Chloroflexota bacterium]|nr:hypothetical protein [Chloroflexota bacterium]